MKFGMKVHGIKIQPKINFGVHVFKLKVEGHRSFHKVVNILFIQFPDVSDFLA